MPQQVLETINFPTTKIIADLKHMNKEKPSRLDGLDNVSRYGQAWTSRVRKVGGSSGVCRSFWQ